MEIKKRTNWRNVLKIGGCFASWCIGSGFVTGAETRQYFCCYGIYGYIGMALAMLLHLYLITKYFSLGYERKYTDPLQVFDYYCGPKLGMLFRALGYGLLYAAPVVMISGFGATVSQYFDVPTPVGSIILAGICLIVILLGLKRLVEVTGACGPIIVGLALVTGIIYLAQHAKGLTEGIRIAPTLGMPRIAPHWLIGTLYYTTCTPMQAAPFFVAVAAGENNRNDLMKGGVVGVIMYLLGAATMTTANFSNIKVLSQFSVPNLEIANSISEALGFIFVIIIFLGIFSSTVPSMFTLIKSITKEERTPKYNWFAAVVVVASLLCSMLLPFDTWLGLVYGVYGVIGAVMVLLIVWKSYREKKAKQVDAA